LKRVKLTSGAISKIMCLMGAFEPLLVTAINPSCIAEQGKKSSIASWPQWSILASSPFVTLSAMMVRTNMARGNGAVRKSTIWIQELLQKESSWHTWSWFYFSTFSSYPRKGFTWNDRCGLLYLIRYDSQRKLYTDMMIVLSCLQLKQGWTWGFIACQDSCIRDCSSFMGYTGNGDSVKV